jgi:hypothetical protein
MDIGTVILVCLLFGTLLGVAILGYLEEWF